MKYLAIALVLIASLVCAAPASANPPVFIGGGSFQGASVTLETDAFGNTMQVTRDAFGNVLSIRQINNGAFVGSTTIAFSGGRRVFFGTPAPFIGVGVGPFVGFAERVRVGPFGGVFIGGRRAFVGGRRAFGF